MADKRDYYEVLGLDKSAPDADIKKAYRSFAKENHPDLHPGDAAAETRFKEIGEAYAVLSDADKKSKYDQFGHAAFDPSMGGGGAGFSDLGDIFGDIFGGIFGGGRQQRPNAPRQGESIRIGLRLSFEEAAFGCEKEVSIARIETCDDCLGTGCAEGETADACSNCGGTGVVRVQQRSPFGVISTNGPCPHCAGTGKVIKNPCKTCRGTTALRRQRKIMVTFPAGIDENQTIILKGMGHTGANNGPPGDLLVVVAVAPHEFFMRQGTSVLYELPISFVQAALGDSVEVPTIDGKVKYTIPEGTQTGTVFRLRDKGIPSIRGRGRGDQYITVKVTTPTNLTTEQINLLRQFGGVEDDHGVSGKKKKKK